MSNHAEATIDEWGLLVSLLRTGDRMEFKFHPETRERPDLLAEVMSHMAGMSGTTLTLSEAESVLERLFQCMDFLTTIHDMVIEVAPELSPFSMAGGRS